MAEEDPAVIAEKRRAVTVREGDSAYGELAERIVRIEGAHAHLKENHSHKLEALRSAVEGIAVRTSPKPINWIPVAALGLTLLTMILGAWWALSEKFSQRPTTDQIEKLFRTHSEIGHPLTNQQIQDLREQQIKISNALDNVQRDTKAIRDDVSALRK